VSVVVGSGIRGVFRISYETSLCNAYLRGGGQDLWAGNIIREAESEL
jgi:hypothetical protein